MPGSLQDYSPLAEAMAQRLDDFALGLHVSADGADLIAGVARLGAGGFLGVYQDVAVAQGILYVADVGVAAGLAHMFRAA